MIHASNGFASQGPKNESRVYLAIFVTSFLVLLSVALVAQLLTWRWRSWLPGAEDETSLIGAVKAAVYTFMPHLN